MNLNFHPWCHDASNVGSGCVAPRSLVADYDVLAPFPGVHKTLRDGDAGVAQLEERLTCNEDVAGSTPVTGSNFERCRRAWVTRSLPQNSATMRSKSEL